MANPDHVERLLAGVEGWNAWREESAEIPDLSEANLIRANLSGTANPIEPELSGAKMYVANLSGADLSMANLSGANLSGADLSGAILSGARLRQASLSGAHLGGASLSLADLSLADLSIADLSRADLSGATLSETVFGNTQLSEAKNLDECDFYGPCTIDLRTLRKSWPLPLAFLRGVGLPDEYIDYLPSFMGDAIEYYSCFISHSTKDAAFVKRLHADLQESGVRCWYAPEDMKRGRKIHEQIFEAIKLHDKLLLILSEHSIGSNWVKTEIRRARRRERKEGRKLLFPVGLCAWSELQDWELFDADEGTDLATEVRQYFIPDFSDWRSDQSKYEAEFEKLLRDLKATQD